MNEFGRQLYMPTREPEPEFKFPFGAGLAPLLVVAGVVGLVVFAGYKVLKSTSPTDNVAASDSQLAQMGQRLDEMEHRLDQIEKKRKVFNETSQPATPSTLTAAVDKPVPPKSQLTFSRPVRVLYASSPSPANSPATSSPAGNQTPPNNSNSDRAAAALTQQQSGQQQWEATADRLGNVVGELDSQRNALDSQRDAIERDRARLDELAGRFARNSQPFTLEKGSDQQQVGPVRLLLRSTDPKNQRYTMRMIVDDKTVELKDRALHEAIQFYASGGKLTFELVVSQISSGGVAGRLVFPQMIARR